jgi:PAS domain S-box-containing protein
MLADALQDKVVHYLTGAMPPVQRENFEVLLAARPELQDLVQGLQSVTAAVALADVRALTEPPVELKARVLAALDLPPLLSEPDGLVVTDPAGLIEWISPGFSAMCGYTLAELKGRKPGGVLQGPATDAAAVARIRAALSSRQDCQERLVNYHKDGSTYRVDVHIAAIPDDEGRPLCYVAREFKLPA